MDTGAGGEGAREGEGGMGRGATMTYTNHRNITTVS